MTENRYEKSNLMKYKMLYTMIILLVYLIGKSLPLYGVDLAVYRGQGVNSEALLTQTISGDLYQCSIFALGISPFMLSSLLVQLVSAFQSKEAKARTSPNKVSRITMLVTLVFAHLQAIYRVRRLCFVDQEGLLWLQVTAVFEMVAGAMMILWLSERNKQYGIGGQTMLIFVNIVDGLMAMLIGHTAEELAVPVGVSLIVLVIIIFMENTELRIPVQRISIHNIYADKNYMAIKLNPIGVMPVMFSTAFFMLPQLLLSGLNYLFPENAEIAWWQENMTLDNPLGIGIYILIVYFLTIFFSMVFINPGDTTEQFLKSGDSILNVHAGRDTKRYLTARMLRLGILSATVMSVCIGVPMALHLTGKVDSTLVMLPSSVMMLTGIWCNLYREYEALRDLEAYRPFI